MDLLSPGSDDDILDVGVTNSLERSSNYLEANYPFRERITAVSIEPVPLVEKAFPDVTFVRADGRSLPFRDRQFAVGFSNAVIEHVGSRGEQAAFVAEMLRTCRRVFITTPNRAFPIDPHTLYPFAHWLPSRPRGRVYEVLGKPMWKSEAMLNPLASREFLRLFPASSRPRLIRTSLGTNLVVLAGAPGA
jgi:SAM-dependent methyltransferase